MNKSIVYKFANNNKTKDPIEQLSNNERRDLASLV